LINKRPRFHFNLLRDTGFSFVCGICSKCCHGKAIRVGPYEIVRIARRLGLTTGRFLSRYTEQGGTILRLKSGGACVFLGPQGCRIHSDRPYVCRLYPLARKVDVKGREKFARIPLEPECRGRLGRNGTVDSFLAGQDVLPFWRFNNRYEIITKKMIRILGRIAAKSKRLGQGGKVGPQKASNLSKPLKLPPLLSPWFDVDASVAEYCRKRRRKVPDDIEKELALHIEAMNAWLKELGA